MSTASVNLMHNCTSTDAHPSSWSTFFFWLISLWRQNTSIACECKRCGRRRRLGRARSTSDHGLQWQITVCRSPTWRTLIFIDWRRRWRWQVVIANWDTRTIRIIADGNVLATKYVAALIVLQVLRPTVDQHLLGVNHLLISCFLIQVEDQRLMHLFYDSNKTIYKA